MSFPTTIRCGRTFSPRMVALQTRTFFAKKCPKKSEEASPLATTTVADIPVGYKLLKETQAKFQIKDDLPVWLKGGTADRILYMSTLGLAVVGLGSSLIFIGSIILKS